MKTPSFQKDYGVQKYANVDPAPRMAFFEEQRPLLTKKEAIFYSISWTFVIGILIYDSFFKG